MIDAVQNRSNVRGTGAAAIFNLIVYLAVDLLYFAVDPRLRARAS